MFRFTHTPIDPQALRAQLADPACGGYAAFEGWVRDSHEGMRVRRLEYEAFAALAVREGERILAEAIARFGVAHAACLHRVPIWKKEHYLSGDSGWVNCERCAAPPAHAAGVHRHD